MAQQLCLIKFASQYWPHYTVSRCGLRTVQYIAPLVVHFVDLGTLHKKQLNDAEVALQIRTVSQCLY